MKIPELLAPAGGMRQLRAAVRFGADAVYVGMKQYGLRAFAGNFDDEELAQAVRIAHGAGRRLYVTMNIFAYDEDVPGMLQAARRARQDGVDALIVTDPGVIELLHRELPDMPLHVSTQANTLNSLTAALYHRIVPRLYAVQNQLSQSGNGEDRLRQDGSPQHEAELQAGELYISAPGGYITASDETFGTTSSYTESADASAWTITEPGTYRIVINTAENKVTVYDPATDLKNTVVSYNNTVDGINPYEQEVTELWMYGGFNSYSTGTDCFVGLDPEYTLKQSLADPNVFVYYGDVLPRLGGSDANNDGAYKTGFINFKVSNIHNNVYCYGSTADAKRNDHSGYIENINLGESLDLVAGQSDNRYAYFIIPENVNYIEVDIENLTVIFDNK